jgi:hypothetical protein
MFIMRSAGPRNIHNLLLFSLLCFSLNPLNLQFTCHENLPNKCAEISRQKNLSWQFAGFMFDFNPLNLLAKNRRHFNSRLLLAREPPFPAKNSQARPAPPPFPPPPPTPPMEEGGGGRRLTRLAHASWTGTFTFIPLTWMVTHFYDTTYMHSRECFAWIVIIGSQKARHTYKDRNT